jgi:hypothetical protein
VTVRNDIGEELFEDDEKPRPFAIGETTIASECLGKSLQPNELGSLAAHGDRIPHRGLMSRNGRRQPRASLPQLLTITPIFRDEI